MARSEAHAPDRWLSAIPSILVVGCVACGPATTLELFSAGAPDGGRAEPADAGSPLADARPPLTELGAATVDGGRSDAFAACEERCKSPKRCDPMANTCVECITDADCDDGGHCAPLDGTCHECVQESDCVKEGTVCNQHTLACAKGCAAGCDTDEVCDPSVGACVGCLDDAHCRALIVGVTCVADESTCTNCSDHCELRCLSRTSKCVECLDNSDCSGAHPWCLQIANKCVACVTNSDCTKGVCSAKHACE